MAVNLFLFSMLKSKEYFIGNAIGMLHISGSISVLATGLLKKAPPVIGIDAPYFPDDKIRCHTANDATRDGCRQKERMKDLTRKKVPLAMHSKTHGSEQRSTRHHRDGRRHEEHSGRRLHDLGHRFRIQREAEGRHKGGRVISHSNGKTHKVDSPTKQATEAGPVKPGALNVEQHSKANSTEERRNYLDEPSRYGQTHIMPPR